MSAFCGCVLEIVREGFLGDAMAAAVEKIRVVSEGRLDFQPEISTTGHCKARAGAQTISFRCDLILNLSVGSTSEIKVLELREPKIAKLQGKN